MVKNFQLESIYSPKGDQPQAINNLVENIKNGKKYNTLLGVTGSGKTFTIANVIKEIKKPTLVISHNKTLAAQLYGELKSFFPNNAVEYFISYYDYYQPEAYLPTSDMYIEKSTLINAEIEKLRLRATSSLISRKDVIIVASVSCIYGLGSPNDYKQLAVKLNQGDLLDRNKFFNQLIEMQYERNKYDVGTGSFRVKGDTIDIYPAYDDKGIRLHTFGDEIEKIQIMNFLKGDILSEKKSIEIFPAKHFVVSQPKLKEAIGNIEKELKERLLYFQNRNMLVEYQRLEQRVNMDVEFLKEMGVCSGIENYSRHLSGRKEGHRPYCLLDFFPEDFVVVIDESHVSIPQIRAMYNGDRARKKTLVDYGFRLPSALDNRPLKFTEFEKVVKNVIYVSATPSEYEMEQSGGEIIEQINRPTGILDPKIHIRPSLGQIDDLFEEIRKTTAKKEKILVTTLTKKMSENITQYLKDNGVRARYLHSEIDSLERVKIIRDLRLDKFDVLVGINLLREGIDLPEVSLVAILDADREGFLRDRRSLLQISGRAARNIEGRVIFYGDNITKAMQSCIDETNRRRDLQNKFNKEHGIVPKNITKNSDDVLSLMSKKKQSKKSKQITSKDKQLILLEIEKLTKVMGDAAEELRFEKAAQIRDQIKDLKDILVLENE